MLPLKPHESRSDSTYLSCPGLQLRVLGQNMHVPSLPSPKDALGDRICDRGAHMSEESVVNRMQWSQIEAHLNSIETKSIASSETRC